MDSSVLIVNALFYHLIIFMIPHFFKGLFCSNCMGRSSDIDVMSPLFLWHRLIFALWVVFSFISSLCDWSKIVKVILLLVSWTSFTMKWVVKVITLFISLYMLKSYLYSEENCKNNTTCITTPADVFCKTFELESL